MRSHSSMRLRRNRGMSSSVWKTSSSLQWFSGREMSSKRETNNRLPLRKICRTGRRGLRMLSDSKNWLTWRRLQKKSVSSTKLSRKLSFRKISPLSSKPKRNLTSSVSVKRSQLERKSFWSKLKEKRLSKPSYVLLTKSKKSKKLKELPSSPKNLKRDSRRRGRDSNYRRSR